MKDAGLPNPNFQKECTFTGILRRSQKTSVDGAQKTTQKIASRIIQVLKVNPQASRAEITTALGDITVDGVKYQLSKLKKQWKIERIGSD